MIITVTMNPAIDKTVTIDRLCPGGLNRIKEVEYDAGGKGINVSKTIKALGGESIATGFLGRNTGKNIEMILDEKGICHDFVWVNGETRTNTKIVEENGSVTELNEPGPVIDDKQMDRLIRKILGYAKEGTLFVLSGSVPKGVDPMIYAHLISLLHEKGAKVLLDADGELLKNGLSQSPDMIKPNRAELEKYAGLCRESSEETLLNTARSMKGEDVKSVVVSMGEDGAVFLLDSYEARCPALPVKPRSTVGAGDAMVAALAFSWEQKLTGEEAVRLCMAASAGAVTTVGTKPPSRELVNELKQQVVIREI